MENQVKRFRTIIECKGCHTGKISSVEWIYNFFERLSKIADMRILSPPIVHRVPVAQAVDQIHTDTDYGISGYVFWLESGASIHTWPEHDGFVAVDIFSCKEFDCRDVWDFVFFETEASSITCYSPSVIYSEARQWNVRHTKILEKN